MRIPALLALAVLTAAPAWASTTAPTSTEVTRKATPESDLIARGQVAAQKLQNRDFAGARDDLTAIVNDPGYAALPAEGRRYIMLMLAAAEFYSGDGADAYTHTLAIGPGDDNDSRAMYDEMLIEVAPKAGHRDVAVTSLTDLITVEPDRVNSFDSSAILATERSVMRDANGPGLRRTLLETLWRAGYKSSHPFSRPGHLWFDLFELEVAVGDDGMAKSLLPAMTEPELVIRLRCDKRYSPYIAGTQAAGDFQAVLDASISDARAVVRDQPRSLEAVTALITRLADANRLDEALALDEATEAQIKTPAATPAFDDQDAQVQWIYMLRAIILGRQGKADDALSTQETARDTSGGGKAGTKGGDMVSQPINLGGEYVAQGRAQDALDAVKDVDANVSAYGKMAAMQVRACAYAQLKNKAKLDEIMTYVKAHADDGWGPYQQAMLCADDTDGLAQVLVARLDDPLTRNETLYQLQGYLTHPQNDFDRMLNTAWQKTEAHPEIKAAIAKYGVQESYPMYQLVGD